MEYTIGIIESLKRIYSGILVGAIEYESPIMAEKKQVFKSCMPRFISTFSSNIFKNEYALFYEIIVTLRSRVFNTIQYDTIIENNRDLILDSPYIDTKKWSTTTDGRQATDDEKVEAFKLDTLDLFIELSNTLVTEEEFQSSCEVYIDWFKNQYMLETAQNMTLIMSDSGFEAKEPGKRRKSYKGELDAQLYYNNRMKVIRELSEENRIKSSVLNEKWFEQDMLKESRPDDKTLFAIGIPEMDETIGELRRSNMLGILGPPKGGKTRFSNFVVQKALSMGLNVCVWALEGTQEEWTSMQIACYIRRINNYCIDSKKILQRKYSDNPQLKQHVTAAKMTLSTSPDMGRLSYIEGTAYVEEFIDVLQNHYDNENPFDVIVIDSLVNILSKTHKGKVERISEAYMLLKDFVSNKLKVPALAILPAQLKQETVDSLRKNPEDTIDVTAGGESAETIRSPDEVIGLFSSKAERDAGIMKIYSVASRHSSNFEDFQVRCDLGACYFWSDPTLNQH